MHSSVRVEHLVDRYLSFLAATNGSLLLDKSMATAAIMPAMSCMISACILCECRADELDRSPHRHHRFLFFRVGHAEAKDGLALTRSSRLDAILKTLRMRIEQWETGSMCRIWDCAGAMFTHDSITS